MGNAFYDVDGSAHKRYGILTEKGAVIVLRPDGMIGTVCNLVDGNEASRYFAQFVIARKEESIDIHNDDRQGAVLAAGEVSLATDNGPQ